MNLSFALAERKRNRRRGQGGENIAEKQKLTDMNATFSPISMTSLGGSVWAAPVERQI
jgi:hypothetical protein